MPRKDLKASDPSQRPVWTPKDVAEFLLLDERTVTKQAKQGVIPGFQAGKSWRFSREKIQALV